MTLTIELTPEDEAKLCSAARTRGMNPTELARKLVFDNLPVPPPTEGEEKGSEHPAIALLNRWIKEDATDDPEEIRRADEEVDELLRNLNENRLAAGERPLFPDRKSTRLNS